MIYGGLVVNVRVIAVHVYPSLAVGIFAEIAETAITTTIVKDRAVIGDHVIDELPGHLKASALDDLIIRCPSIVHFHVIIQLYHHRHRPWLPVLL